MQVTREPLSVATLLAANNNDLKTVQDLMRHEKISTTMEIYIGSIEDRVRKPQSEVVTQILPKRKLAVGAVANA